MKVCTSWQYNTSEFGDTITSEVIISFNKKINELWSLLMPRYTNIFTVELGLRPKRIKKLCWDDVFDGRSFRRFLLRSRLRQVSQMFRQYFKTLTSWQILFVIWRVVNSLFAVSLRKCFKTFERIMKII